MFKEKEAQLKKYYEMTKTMLEVLDHGNIHELFYLLEQREECISAINQLDMEAGTILVNEQIQKQLQAQVLLEKNITKKLELTMNKLAKRVQKERNQRFLTRQYEYSLPFAKGFFYDTKK